MNSILGNDKATMHAILAETQRLAEVYFKQQEHLPPGRHVADIALENLPEEGLGAKAVLDYFERNFADKLANSAGPRYFGFVTGGATPAAVAADWLVSAYDQNACGSNDSIAPQLERQTIHFFKQLFHLDDGYFGSFVTGATMSNFSGLAQARQWIGEQRGVDYSDEGLSAGEPIRIISGTPHSSVLKSLSMLGIGRKSLVRIQTLADREAIDTESLERYLQENGGPHIVVANAGTVNTVDFDDLEMIGRLKQRHQFWLHTDAAFGGFAACSEKYKHYLKGINHADSITIDAHKWLNVPYDAAMQFTRHKSVQLRVFQNSAAYLGDPEQSTDYFHFSPENSRRFRALPSWFSLMAYGKEGYREIVERNCTAASYFGTLLEGSGNFRLLAPVKMNVVCFTLREQDIDGGVIQEFLQAVRDDGQAFFTPTVYRGVPAIRAAISNWQTETTDIDLAMSALNRVYREHYYA